MKGRIEIRTEAGVITLTFGGLATVTFEPTDFIRFVRECNSIVAHLTGEK